MKKRLCVSLLPTLILTFVCHARAQQPAKIPRIGFLTTGGASNPPTEALRQGLRQFGYVEEKNILIEPRYAEGKSERLEELAKELVRLQVYVIVTTATEPSLSAQRATKTIPIVMGGGGDPVAA